MPKTKPAEYHDDATLFAECTTEGSTLVSDVVRIVDAGVDAGVTIAAAATSTGLIALATVVTQDAKGAKIEPVRTLVQLDVATMIRLTALVPIELLDPHAGADVIYLHPGKVMADVVVTQNGITSAPCQAAGCERRIEHREPDGEWSHIPNALGLTPAHDPVAPADAEQS